MAATGSTAGERAGGPRLSHRAAFALLVATFASLGASSAVPTPLYRVYQAEWGFSPVTLTVVFAVYAIAVLATLLTVGGLSDHVGRLPMIRAAVCTQILGAGLFAIAHGVPELVAARVAQGVGAGMGTPAIVAALLDLDRERGPVANAVSPLLGTAAGSLLAGVVVQFLPWPMSLIYILLIVTLVGQGVASFGLAESSPRVAGWRRSLRPRLGVPAAARRAVLLTAPLLAAVWTLFGFYAALGPSLLYTISGSSSITLGGLTVFLFGGAAAATTVGLRHLHPDRVMTIAATTLVVGVVACLLSVGTGSIPVFLAGALVSGVGFGAGLQAAMRIVLPLALPTERAGLASALYLIMYLAFSVPTVIAGLLVADGPGLKSTAYIYGAGLAVLGALALLASRPSEPVRA